MDRPRQLAAVKPFFTILVVYVGFFLGMLVDGYLARHLDLDGLGDYKVALSVASIASALVVLGGQGAVRRFVPTYIGQQKFAEAKGFIAYFLKTALKLGSAATAVSLGFAIVVKLFGYESLYHEAMMAIVITPLIAVSLFLGATTQSLHRPVLAIMPNELLKPALFYLGIVIWLRLFSTFNEIETIGILFVASAIQVTVQIVLMRRALPFHWSEIAAVYDADTWRRVSLPLLYSALINSFLVRVDILALEILDESDHAVGVFAILVLITALVWKNYMVMSTLISPRIAELDNDGEGRQRLYNQALTFLLLSNIAVISVVWFFADGILEWFHGDMPEYKPWLGFLLVGAAVNCTLEGASPFVRFGGHHDKVARLASAIMAANVVVTCGAVLAYGLQGALVSLVAMRTIRGLSYMFIARRHMGLRPFGRFAAP